MALITSYCGVMRYPGQRMALITSGLCVPRHQPRGWRIATAADLLGAGFKVGVAAEPKQSHYAGQVSPGGEYPECSCRPTRVLRRRPSRRAGPSAPGRVSTGSSSVPTAAIPIEISTAAGCSQLQSPLRSLLQLQANGWPAASDRRVADRRAAGRRGEAVGESSAILPAPPLHPY